MEKLYYKRCFEESRNEDSEVWGTCNYYFETNQDGEVLRQIEMYQNGRKLKYSKDINEDEFGALADQPIDISEFENCIITTEEFESQWK